MDRNILLIGKTGVGKSHTGSTILDDDTCFEFKSKASPSSCTSNCKAASKTIEGKTVKVIDSPGFFDSRPEDIAKPEILKCIAECSSGIHAIVIVLKIEPYTPHERDVVKKITDMLGEEALKYAVVLFTHGDQLEDDQTIEEFVYGDDQNEHLKELVEKCGKRCHVIDNRYWNHQEHEYRRNRVQVEKLLNTIEKMVRQNGYYTNEMLQAVEAEIQKEIGNGRHNRKEAILRVLKKLLVKSLGLTSGVLVGALFGLGVSVCVVALLGVCAAKYLRNVPSVAIVGSTVVGTGLIVGGTVVGATAGGIVGVQAVKDGDTAIDALKNAASANWENAKCAFEKSKGLFDEVNKALNNETHYGKFE